MHSPRADDLAPLRIFSRRNTSKLRGPRPCISWLRAETPVREEAEGNWSWTCRQADLSRTSTMYSYTSSESSFSNQSSVTSESSSAPSPIDYTPNFPSDHKSTHRLKCRPERRRPSGPRPLSSPRSSTSPVRPTLSINTSLSSPVSLEQQVLPLPLAEFPHIAPTEPTTPVPQLPPAIPFSPSDLLDWDTIFELLGIAK